jgi:hypothetical protein
MLKVAHTDNFILGVTDPYMVAILELTAVGVDASTKDPGVFSSYSSLSSFS